MTERYTNFDYIEVKDNQMIFLVHLMHELTAYGTFTFYKKYGMTFVWIKFTKINGEEYSKDFLLSEVDNYEYDTKRFIKEVLT